MRTNILASFAINILGCAFNMVVSKVVPDLGAPMINIGRVFDFAKDAIAEKYKL